MNNPISHTHDPPSSREAARRLEESGRRAKHCALVLALVRAHPGSTAIELWEAADLDTRIALKEPQEVRRRLTDLKADGEVTQGPQRKCLVKRTTMVTWVSWDDVSQKDLFPETE